MKIKIYDCFTYFNEDQLLKLRLETLWDVVDYFVICESILTHTGNVKPINFNIDNFSKYESKIRYILIDSYSFQSSNPWVYENYQRNYLMNGLYDAQNDDWVIVSDLDEIPKPESIRLYEPNIYLRGSFNQEVFLYFLNNRLIDDALPVQWSLPKITTYQNLCKVFTSPEELRNYRSFGIFRGIKKIYMKFKTQNISPGGWHFTWMGGVERIIDKLKNTAHQEFNRPENLIPEEIEKKIRSGVNPDILNRENCELFVELLPLDDRLPLYLTSNQHEFHNLLLISEEKL